MSFAERQRLRQLEGVTLDQLERRMEHRWQALVQAPSTTSTAQLERLYGAYLDALDSYQLLKRQQAGGDRRDA